MERCELNRGETWCLTHHCYPRTCERQRFIKHTVCGTDLIWWIVAGVRTVYCSHCGEAPPRIEWSKPTATVSAERAS